MQSLDLTYNAIILKGLQCLNVPLWRHEHGTSLKGEHNNEKDSYKFKNCSCEWHTINEQDNDNITINFDHYLLNSYCLL